MLAYWTARTQGKKLIGSTLDTLGSGWTSVRRLVSTLQELAESVRSTSRA